MRVIKGVRKRMENERAEKVERKRNNENVYE